MQKRDSGSVPRDTQKCEQEDCAATAVSGSERIAPYRLDQSRVKAYTTGFSQTSIFISDPVPSAAAQTAPNGVKERASFCLVFRSLNTTSSHRMFSMGYRRAKSTQGNTNFQKGIFWQTTSGSLPAGLNGAHAILMQFSSPAQPVTLAISSGTSCFVPFWRLILLMQ